MAIFITLREPLLRTISAFVQARRAIAALEFALTAPILLFTVLGTIGVGLLVFEQAALHHATADASRLIRTGQAQSASNAQSSFTSRLCADLRGMLPCSALQVDVQAGSSFVALNAGLPVSANGTMQNTGFVPGGPGQDVLVRVGYRVGTLLPWIGPLIGAGSGPMLISSVAFQNELY